MNLWEKKASMQTVTKIIEDLQQELERKEELQRQAKSIRKSEQ